MSAPNVVNIRKWVDALRSGDYEQGTGALHKSGGTFCCLGVACDLSGVGEWSPPCADDDRFTYVIHPDGYNERGYLPSEVADWLGVEGDCPSVGDTTLAHENDRGKSFAEIADLIEAEWLTEASA